MDDSVVTITVNNAGTIQTPTYAVIDRLDLNSVLTPNAREVVYISSKSGNDLTVTRGVNNSTARAHNSGAILEPILSVGQWADLYTALDNEHNTADGSHDITKIAMLSGATIQTLASKILSSPTITSPTFGGVQSGMILSNPTIALGSLSSVLISSPTIIDPVIAGTGGTTAGMYGYDATDKAIFVGDGTTKQSIYIGAWNDYTPTYGGNGSMTYGTVTTTYAKYALIGRLVIVTIYATGTVGGTPNNRLTATLPLTAVTSVNSGLGGGWTSDGGAGFTAMVLLDSATTVGVQRYDASAYTAGANRIMSITFAYEI